MINHFWFSLIFLKDLFQINKILLSNSQRRIFCSKNSQPQLETCPVASAFPDIERYRGERRMRLFFSSRHAIRPREILCYKEEESRKSSSSRWKNKEEGSNELSRENFCENGNSSPLPFSLPRLSFFFHRSGTRNKTCSLHGGILPFFFFQMGFHCSVVTLFMIVLSSVLDFRIESFKFLDRFEFDWLICLIRAWKEKYRIYSWEKIKLKFIYLV